MVEYSPHHPRVKGLSPTAERERERERRMENGRAHKKNFKHFLNTNIYSYLETFGGKSFNLSLNVVHFFNASVN